MRPNRKSSSSNDLNFKIILIGESGTGKSCLMNRYVKRNFTSLYQTTIGTQFQSKTVQIDDQHTIKMQIWDTAGQQSFRSIIRAFFRNANAILLVYDITRKSTLDALADWKALTKQSAPENALFILVGTHLDLQSNRQVSRIEAQAWMNEHQVDIFFETSSKTDINVTTVFEEIGKRLFCRYMDRKRSTEVVIQAENLKLTQEVAKKQNGCC